MNDSRRIEIWHRPWAMVDIKRRHRLSVEVEPMVVPATQRAPLWVYTNEGGAAVLDGRPDTGEPVVGFALGNSTRWLAQLPFPLRTTPGVTVALSKGKGLVTWPSAPERPPEKLEPRTDDDQRARRILLRAQKVWDRLRDVETALADPAELWNELRRRWTQDADDVDPRMDIIVRHAKALSSTLDALDRSPRRILRRTHKLVSLARVQELDRRAMTWLVRQPGETLAERGGNRQRILATTREQNYDTLENRVLRAYAEEARHVARDYLDRNRKKQHTRRARIVADYGRRCKRLARDLEMRGVRLAEAGVTPNYVLQQNPQYLAVWSGWIELLDRKPQLDELWRWQARSWEEFGALAVMVALSTINGARLIASAPLTFRDEQARGSWIDHDNPLGVFHLPEQHLVVEVRYHMRNPHLILSDFAAPIWIRYGSTDDPQDFLKYAAVWPIWDTDGGLVAGETEEIAALLPLGRQAQLRAAMVLRPSADDGSVDAEQSAKAMATTIGVDGTALSDGIAAIAAFLSQLLLSEAA